VAEDGRRATLRSAEHQTIAAIGRASLAAIARASSAAIARADRSRSAGRATTMSATHRPAATHAISTSGVISRRADPRADRHSIRAAEAVRAEVADLVPVEAGAAGHPATVVAAVASAPDVLHRAAADTSACASQELGRSSAIGGG
jgi:hypothetical protein